VVIFLGRSRRRAIDGIVALIVRFIVGFNFGFNFGLNFGLNFGSFFIFILFILGIFAG
jgi:hypothetical protein